MLETHAVLQPAMIAARPRIGRIRQSRAILSVYDVSIPIGRGAVRCWIRMQRNANAGSSIHMSMRQG